MLIATLTVAIDSICKSSKQENMVKEHQPSLDELGAAYECQSMAHKIPKSTTNHLSYTV